MAKSEKPNQYPSPKIKEYSRVKVLNDKDQYTAMGISKGMKGVVLYGDLVNDSWYVLFNDSKTKRDIAQGTISGKDLEIIK